MFKRIKEYFAAFDSGFINEKQLSTALRVYELTAPFMIKVLRVDKRGFMI